MEKENTGINVQPLLPPLVLHLDRRTLRGKTESRAVGKEDAITLREKLVGNDGLFEGLGRAIAVNPNPNLSSNRETNGPANRTEATTRLVGLSAINHHGGKMNDYEETILFLADLAEEYAAEADLEELDFQEAA